MNPFFQLPTSSFQLPTWLMAAQGRGIQPGLERMERLLAALGHPEMSLRCLHVAGTNGKGSVCAIAESVLRAAGYRTGLYTSPHLVDFAERIRIAGEPVGHEDLERGIGRLQKAVEGWSEEELPTFFELVTALAFDLLACADCEVVILETGLGGRLDATNTAPKIACAITPLALDHTEWLGESLAEIAREKAGIFRSGIPAVIAPQEAEAAEALASEALTLGTHCIWSRGGENLPSDLVLGLAGSYQRENAALALALLEAGGFHLSHEAISRGLETVSWPGRFQRLFQGRLILDGAHNVHAARQLVATWREEFGDQKCRLVFGALSDKYPEALLEVLESIAEEIFLVPVASPRSVDPFMLSKKLRVSTQVFGSLKEALAQALETNNKEISPRSSPVLLAGSLFLVGEALAWAKGESVFPRSQ